MNKNKKKSTTYKPRQKYDPLNVELEGKTGRPVAKSFGYKGISVAEKLKQTFWNKSNQPKPGEKKLYDPREGFNYPLRNKWEDERYGVSKKKKK